MAVNSVLSGVAALTLWFAPAATAERWPWPLTPLTARMSAAVFATVCVISAMAAIRSGVREVSLVTFSLGVLGLLTFIAMLFRGSDVNFDRPMSWVLMAWELLLTLLALPLGARWQLLTRNV